MVSTPLPLLPDADLVALVRAGREDAFTAVVERYRERLLAFARRLLRGTGHDADDVVQDALIRAYNGLRATGNEMHLRPWLYMIVRNRAMDDLRRPARVAAELDEVAHLAPVSDASDPAVRAAERELLREVVAEMQRLPERQKLALVMRELDGASHVQMADTLGTSISGAKSLLVRARTALGEAVAA
jgi:RNA polymerase sigma factor (sigma-70 family)